MQTSMIKNNYYDRALIIEVKKKLFLMKISTSKLLILKNNKILILEQKKTFWSNFTVHRKH